MPRNIEDLKQQIVQECNNIPKEMVKKLLYQWRNEQPLWFNQMVERLRVIKLYECNLYYVTTWNLYVTTCIRVINSHFDIQLQSLFES